MALRLASLPENLRSGLRRLFGGPYALAFLPALALGAFWSGGESALLAVALGLPLMLVFSGAFRPRPGAHLRARDPVTGLPTAAALTEAAEDAAARGDAAGLRSGCFLLQIEDFSAVQARHGPAAADMMLKQTAQRLRTVLREHDSLGRMADGQFGIVLHAVARLDLESMIQLASRLQAAVEEPHALSGHSVYPECAVGFCLPQRGRMGSGASMLRHAAIALEEARASGPSTIRAYSDEMGQVRRDRDTLADEAIAALERGQILPWFQPQISTDTGHVTGFEALARWIHPDRGLIAPGEFIPVLEQTGQIERMGEIILYGALNALVAWDGAGVHVPCVAVNFSGHELRNPHLPDRIRWDLDRFDLTPDRLTIEILETVVVSAPEDLAVRNIKRLADMGCRIDLDDFGTGNASIAAIRSFAIERLKIDRSFVTRVDSDAEQQRMVSAIVTMADRLGLETLAEGVETAGEHTMLAQLGCRHVQGFGIGRPMPFDETVKWINRHNSKLGPLPDITRKSG